MTALPTEPFDRPAPPRERRYEDQAGAMIAAIHRQIASAGTGSVEVVRGGSAVAALAYGASASARAEVLSLEPWQAFIPLQELLIADQIDLALTRRGVDQRVVIAQSVESRNDAATLEELARMGDPTRYNPAVPIRLLVYDRQRAFIAIDAANTRAGAYVTTDPGIVGLACQVFHDVWKDATPPPAAPAAPSTAGSPDLLEQVLHGLAAGSTDEAIGRRLGVSARTVRRAVADLQRQYDTTSRFQLALVVGGHRTLRGRASG